MEITEDEIILNGDAPGPTSVILAGVHGNERGGIKAFTELIPQLAIAAGRVIFLFGNPRAIERNVRFTEANLNRMFKPEEDIPAEQKASYEFERAQFIKRYLDQADALLDIHSSFTPESPAFIIAEANSQPVTERLPFNLVVSGFDTVEPGGTDSYMNMHGKMGICIECGYLGDVIGADIAKQSLLAFLTIRGHISEKMPIVNKQSHCHMNRLYLTKSDRFALAKQFADFEPVSKGQLIGMDGEAEVRADEDGVILFARNRAAVGEEAFLFGRFA